MSVQYDPYIIEKYAQKLYNRAGLVVFGCCLVSLGFGFLLGLFLVEVAKQNHVTIDPAFIVIAVVIALGAVGLLVGLSVSFKYKLQAQMALCQMQIEQNTKRLLERKG